MSPRSAPACPGGGKRSEPGASRCGAGRGGAGAPAARSAAVPVELGGEAAPSSAPRWPGRPVSRRLRTGGALAVRGSRRTCPAGGERRGARPGAPGAPGWRVDRVSARGQLRDPWRAFWEIWLGGRRPSGGGLRRSHVAPGGRGQPGAAPCRSGPSAAGSPLSGAELEERLVWSLGFQTRSPAALTCFVTLDGSLRLFEPQFAHLSNGEDNSPTLQDLW